MAHLGENNVTVFDKVEWAANGGTNEEDLVDYLKEFGEICYKRLVMLIDRVSGCITSLLLS